MSFEVGAAVAVVLIVFAALLAVLKFMKSKGLSFTVRVFSALGMGIVLGVAIQLALGRGSDAAKCALDWMSLVGTGYISLLKMLVMPLIFVAIVGAFTRTEATENLGKIGISVLAVLLGTVAIAAVFGWATIAFSGLAGADFTQGTVDASKMDALQTRSDKVADTTIPQTILSFIPTNVFADLAGTRSTSTIAVVIFSALVGLAYLKLRNRDSEQADFFRRIIDSLYGIVMCIVKMVVGPHPLTACIALIANVVPPPATYAAILDLGGAHHLLATWPSSPCSSCILLILAGEPASQPRHVPEEGLPRALLRVRVAHQRRCPAHEHRDAVQGARRRSGDGELRGELRHVHRPERLRGHLPGHDGHAHRPDRRHQRVRSRRGSSCLIAVIVISSFGVAGVGGGATFASLIVLGTMGLPIEIVGLDGLRRAAHRHGPHRAQRE